MLSLFTHSSICITRIIEEITATSHQSRETKLNVGNSKLRERPQDHGSQIFFHYMFVRLQKFITRWHIGPHTSILILDSNYKFGAASSSIERPHQGMVEQQIGGTKDVDLNLHNLEDESLLLPCKISSPFSFFPLLSSSFGGSVLKFRSSLSVFIGFFILM